MTAETPGRTSIQELCAWFFLALLIAVPAVLICLQLWQHNKAITLEDRLMENAQVVFLACAIVGHLWQRYRATLHIHKLCYLVLAMLCFSVLVRELDIHKFGASSLWSLTENLLRLVLLAAWLFTIWRTFRAFADLWAARGSILISPASLLTACATFLYIVSWLFDKEFIPLDQEMSRFCEEAIQMTATIYFFAASLKPLKPPRNANVASSSTPQDHS